MNGACSETVCFGESCSGHGICQAVSYDDIVRDEHGDVVAKYKNCLCEKEYRKLKNGKQSIIGYPMQSIKQVSTFFKNNSTFFIPALPARNAHPDSSATQ